MLWDFDVEDVADREMLSRSRMNLWMRLLFSGSLRVLRGPAGCPKIGVPSWEPLYTFIIVDSEI